MLELLTLCIMVMHPMLGSVVAGTTRTGTGLGVCVLPCDSECSPVLSATGQRQGLGLQGTTSTGSPCLLVCAGCWCVQPVPCLWGQCCMRNERLLRREHTRGSCLGPNERGWASEARVLFFFKTTHGGILLPPSLHQEQARDTRRCRGVVAQRVCARVEYW